MRFPALRHCLDFRRFVLYDLEPDETARIASLPRHPLLHRSISASGNCTATYALRFPPVASGPLRLDPEDPANQKAYDRMCMAP